MIVVKFGGTSVGDAAAIKRAADIVRTRLKHQPVVIVSALSGVTNSLLAIGEHGSAGHLIAAIASVEEMRSRHLDIAGSLLRGSTELMEVSSELSAMFDELASLAEALSVLGHLTPRSQDAIASIGERASCQLVVAAFNALDVAADLVDARRVMTTDDGFTRATPSADAIARNARELLLPVAMAGRVPVMGGFIGATSTGITTTLGRGGSDYSASLVGAALGVEAIEIWTDVDGMLTADPRVVNGARLIEEIRFDEASELATFGAKVLHPNTIAPAVRRGIPVFIYNSWKPEGKGTRIISDARRRDVSAIAGKAGVSVVKVQSTRMLLAHGFLRAIFETFERHRVSADVVATSEVSVSVTIDDPTHLDSLVVDLASLGDVSVERKRAIIAIVGAGLGERASTMGRALSALGDVPVRMISLSATEINLTIIVDENDLGEGMCALHDEFFGAASP
ncbi:MAG: lysine-sensitive aspartokinase 3 [Gemmatimonadaceae bacterium]